MNLFTWFQRRRRYKLLRELQALNNASVRMKKQVAEEKRKAHWGWQLILNDLAWEHHKRLTARRELLASRLGIPIADAELLH